MIVTLTLNPSLDRTFAVETLERGQVNRVTKATSEAAGKGVNVARALDANGLDAKAVLPLGGATGIEMSQLLTDAGPPFQSLEISGVTRANVTVIETDGTTTKLNEPGASLSRSEIDRLVDLALGDAQPGTWVVVSGSLPPQVDSDAYAQIVAEARSVGARVAVDASGSALTEVIDAKPDLVKPNLHELRELTGREIQTLGQAVEASRSLLEAGVAMVLTSLGADGAVLCTPEETLFGTSRVTEVANTVGAGDTLLAGFLAGFTRRGSAEDALREALVWARAAIRSPVTTMHPPSDDDRSAVQVTSTFDAPMVLSDE